MNFHAKRMGSTIVEFKRETFTQKKRKGMLMLTPANCGNYKCLFLYNHPNQAPLEATARRVRSQPTAWSNTDGANHRRDERHASGSDSRRSGGNKSPTTGGLEYDTDGFQCRRKQGERKNGTRGIEPAARKTANQARTPKTSGRSHPQAQIGTSKLK